MPGLQLSYSMALGEGNDTLREPFRMNNIFLSHETRITTFTVQAYSGDGKEGGGYPASYEGYSFFGEFTLPSFPLSIFGRYDYFKTSRMGVGIFTPDINKILIGGLAWKFYKDNRLIIDIERSIYERGVGGPALTPEETIAELALEIVF